MNLSADLGQWVKQSDVSLPGVCGYGNAPRNSPSQLRRRERRAAERFANVAAELRGAEKAAAEKFSAKEPAAELIAAEKAAVEVLATEKAADDERAAVKADVEKVDAEELAAEKAAAKLHVAERAAAEERKAEKAVAGKPSTEKAAAEALAAANAEASTSCLGSPVLQVSPAVMKCCNCEHLMTPEHQCGETTPVSSSAIVPCLDIAPVKDVKTEETALLPLCHYCCHLGSGLNPVHYYLQCLCSDKICSCQCYCNEEQLKHKRQNFPTGFTDAKCVDVKDRLRARATAEARAYKLDFRGIPMALRPCEAETCVRM